MNRAQQLEYAALLEERIRRNNANKLNKLWQSMYPWQRRYNASTATNRASALMAANQVGKTRTGTAIDAFHLTGDYPDDWDGHKFNFAPLCWLLGYSGEKTRDLLQSKLFGRLVGQSFEGGLIPADRILDYKSMSGTSGACREVRVRHKSGGIAVCQFWSYSQGQHALMGDVVDWYHIDEEPEDQEIFPQVLTRTLNGDLGKGGRGILTFTPENGKTELVCKFMDEPEQGMYLQTATWDDAPHLTEEAKRQILSIYPEYQRAMRSRGVPLMGAGLIYEHAQSEITCKRFQIPEHFYLINGLDFGWDHPQAHVQLAIDPDSATIYVTQAWKKQKKQPFEAWESVKHWSKDIPTAWPADGLQTEKGSAKQQKDYYEEAGWTMLDDAACWVSGGNGVEAGLMQLNSLMLTGKFKIFDDLVEVIEEVREYHRKQMPSGLSQIVKTKDDLIDACFHPDTEVMTEDGPCRIADMVGSEGLVVSIGGELQRYTNCRRTRENAEVIQVHFTDGTSVTCTADHQFLTVNGWISAIHLHDEIIVRVDACQSFSTARATLGSVATTETKHSCIEIYGNQFMALFRRSITSITPMAIQTITQLKTWSASLGRSIWPSMQLVGLKRSSANIAVKTSLVTQMGTINFAATPASLPLGVEQDLMMSSDCAYGANQSFLPTNTTRSPIAAGAAQEKHGSPPLTGEHTLRVLRIESAGRSDVYCMEVPATKAFALANGAIVHNCRYAFMMARFAIQKAELTKVDYDDYDEQRLLSGNAAGY
jgi:phage terminase large subunit-like protein